MALYFLEADGHGHTCYKHDNVHDIERELYRRKIVAIEASGHEIEWLRTTFYPSLNQDQMRNCGTMFCIPDYKMYYLQLMVDQITDHFRNLKGW